MLDFIFTALAIGACLGIFAILCVAVAWAFYDGRG
jgi:hypothetical protein